MEPTTGHPHTLIVISADHASLYEFLKSRHAAEGGTRVILDRRRHDFQAEAAELREVERRTVMPDAALALMSVLGFMILHRNGSDWSA